MLVWAILCLLPVLSYGDKIDRIITTVWKRIHRKDSQPIDLQDYKAFFLAFDKNHDKKLSKNEIARGAISYNLPAKALKTVLGVVDENNDKFVTVAELENAFHRSDADYNTLLTKTELRNALIRAYTGQ